VGDVASLGVDVGAAGAGAAGSPLWHFAMKEFRVLVRTPIFFMNCVAVNFIIPFMVVAPGIIIGDNTMFVQLKELISGIAFHDSAYYVIGFCFVGGMLLTSLNSIAATAVSRDGADFRFCKYIPIPYETQVFAKMLPAITIGSASTLLLIVFAAVYLSVPAWIIITALISSLAGVVSQAFVGLSAACQQVKKAAQSARVRQQRREFRLIKAGNRNMCAHSVYEQHHDRK
jgi:ABC-2 type transport system permease protein